jgi:hypothetical protein
MAANLAAASFKRMCNPLRIEIMPRPFALLLLAALLPFSGCGRADVVPVSGTATRGGKPVANIVLWFTPSEGRPSWALTDSEGKFELDYNRENKGAKVGKHRVTVVYEPRPSDPGEEQLILSGRKKRPTRPDEMDAILAKYSPAVSTLEVEINKAVDDLEIKLD